MTIAEQLIDAINGNEALMSLNNCPAVPIYMGAAFYGKVQDDEPTIPITIADVETIITTGMNPGQTSVWHVALTPTHHYVIVP